ncbi:MAG: hypothetical protein H3C58_12660 [Fimbriimonadaceae bacterium]|nr:hypothetical protein [Fimbriimonadaceae bacterium]
MNDNDPTSPQQPDQSNSSDETFNGKRVARIVAVAAEDLMLDAGIKVHSSRWAANPRHTRALLALAASRLVFDFLTELLEEEIEPFGEYCLDFALALGESDSQWIEWVNARFEEANDIYIETFEPLSNLMARADGKDPLDATGWFVVATALQLCANLLALVADFRDAEEAEVSPLWQRYATFACHAIQARSDHMLARVRRIPFTQASVAQLLRRAPERFLRKRQ